MVAFAVGTQNGDLSPNPNVAIDHEYGERRGHEGGRELGDELHGWLVRHFGARRVEDASRVPVDRPP